jgi:hypothetical protein
VKGQYDFPKIKYFIAGYFHQNWKDVLEARGLAVNVESVIAEMLREGRAYLSGFRDELEQLLALNLDEHLLRDLLRTRYHCNYDPTIRDSTWRVWVEHLHDRVDQYLNLSL